VKDMQSTLASLRSEVRKFLRQQLEQGAFRGTADTWLSGWNEDFTKELAQRGWVGIRSRWTSAGTAGPTWSASP
jgi:acyl-CoA dehydrogenase